MRIDGSEVLPSHVLVLGCLLFGFWLFSSCCLDGKSVILTHAPMFCHVGMNGMSMRESGSINLGQVVKVDSIEQNKAESCSVVGLVRLPGFEPGYSAWEADVLPS